MTDKTNESESVTENTDNPFAPSRLRLSQDFADTVGVEKQLTTVPVRKPTKQEFFRTPKGATQRLETAVLELKEERETYLVDRPLWQELPGELVPKVLQTAITRQGVLLIWPIRLPGEDGRLDSWNQSALEAAELAQTHWIRLVANMSLGAYDIYTATGSLPEPEWPELSFEEILKVAFKDHFITSLDHPVVRRLRGEV